MGDNVYFSILTFKSLEFYGVFHKSVPTFIKVFLIELVLLGNVFRSKRTTFWRLQDFWGTLY